MSYDVFISHSSHDKDKVVRPLTDALQARGLKVWLDEQQMDIGDSIRGSIEGALQKSRFGIVILSPAYKGSAWGKQELSALFAKEKYQDKVILPIYHNVTIGEVETNWPLLADKISLNSSVGNDELADKIQKSILKSKGELPKPPTPSPVKPGSVKGSSKPWKWLIGGLTIASIAVLSFVISQTWFVSNNGNEKSTSNESKESASLQQAIPKALEKKLKTYKDITSSDPENIEAWNQLGNIYFSLGNLIESTEAYTKVLGLSGKGTDWYASANGSLGNVYKERNQLYKAKAYFETSLRTAESIGWQDGIAKANGSLGSTHAHLNQFDTAEEYYLKAINLNKVLGNQEGVARLSGNLSLLYIHLNKLEKAENYIQSALEINKSANDQKGVAYQYENIGILYQKRQDMVKACQYWTDSVDILKNLVPVRARKIQATIDKECLKNH